MRSECLVFVRTKICFSPLPFSGDCRAFDELEKVLDMRVHDLKSRPQTTLFLRRYEVLTDVEISALSYLALVSVPALSAVKARGRSLLVSPPLLH